MSTVAAPALRERNIVVYDSSVEPHATIAGVYQPTQRPVWTQPLFKRALAIIWQTSDLPRGWQLRLCESGSVVDLTSLAMMQTGAYTVTDSRGAPVTVKLSIALAPDRGPSAATPRTGVSECPSGLYSRADTYTCSRRIHSARLSKGGMTTLAAQTAPMHIERSASRLLTSLRYRIHWRYGCLTNCSSTALTPKAHRCRH